MEKKILHQQSRTLVIEDEHGMKTSYYPSLTWNGLGYSFPTEQKGIPKLKESQMLLSQLDFLTQEAQESIPKLVDIGRSRKIFSSFPV